VKIAFLMDPPERVLPARDTTLAFMREASLRGHEVLHTRAEWLWVEHGRPQARLHPARALASPAAPAGTPAFTLGETGIDTPLDALDAVFVRTDPPFDQIYLRATQILSLCAAGKPFVLNDPAGLRAANEHLYALHFPELTPRSLVSADRARLREFAFAARKGIVVKPIDGHGGMGVFWVRHGDPNAGSILDTLTREGRDPILAQEYIEAVAEGDKRVLLLDGEPIGALNRLPAPGELRANLHVGARPLRAEITERDREIARALAPRLEADGLWFTGLDVIGGLLTEVNVTSPTGVADIERLTGENLSARVLDFVESRARSAAG
jgi:glutathione synthase